MAEAPATATEISRQLGVHPSTALRLLGVLQSNRLVAREDNLVYRLGSGLAHLGQVALEQINLRHEGLSHIRRLSEQTKETVHLAVFEDGQVVYVEKIDTVQTIRIGYSSVGRIAPLHCTAIAKAILAELPASERNALLDGYAFEAFTPNSHTSLDSLKEDLDSIQVNGFATDMEEHQLGVLCIGSAVHSASGAVVGSVSLSIPTVRASAGWVESLAPLVVDTARAISTGLGWDAPNRPPGNAGSLVPNTGRSRGQFA